MTKPKVRSGDWPTPVPAIEHGTVKGYRCHQRRDVEMCVPCRKAGAVDRKAKSELRKRRLNENPEPPRIDGLTPAELTLRMVGQLDQWADTTTTHANPRISDLAVVVSANVIRLRIAVHNLEKALNAELPHRPHNRRAS